MKCAENSMENLIKRVKFRKKAIIFENTVVQ